MLTRFTPLEHIPVFRALLKINIEIEIDIEIARARHDPHQSTDEARSASFRPRKKLYEKGTKYIYIHTWTSRLLDQLGPEGRVGEKVF